MQINKLNKIVSAAIVTALVVAGVMYVWHLSVVRSIQQKQLDINAKYEQSIQSLQLRDAIIKDLNTKIVRLEDAMQGFPEEVPGDLLRIYAYNANTNAEGVGFYLALPEDYVLSQKLKLVAHVLMKYTFTKGIIELKRIEEQAGKKIAIVELRETKANPWAWKGQYFQGSCGGGATTYILWSTFLQPDYTGRWVDGVEFYYEGKPISNDWDHISLYGVKYRK